MDPERRNRVAALLATTDHLPIPVVHEVLAAHDAVLAENLRLQGRLLDVKTELILLQADLQAHRDDGNRLAGWIIRHPCMGPDMAEVLQLHDRL